MQFVARQALVLDCDLFDGRAFQYGPACAVAKGAHNRFLVYYPLGSGKTLSALHAARTFLETQPEGHIIVMTTKSNTDTTWPANISLYLEHVSDVRDRIQLANVYNIDWWFSQDNDFVGHYNRLIQALSKHVTRQHLIQQPPDMLIRYTRQYKLENERRRFRTALTKAQTRQTMLQATIPPFPFMLIVDECQEYLNLSAQSLLVHALADAAQSTLLLTATPLNDKRQYLSLLTMMGTRRLSQAVLWTNEAAEKPVVVDRGIERVPLTPEEWSAHQRQKGQDDAYYARSRQECNGHSKWSAMADQIESDIAKATSPIRIVVYSFFRDRGADGFFDFLRERYHGSVNSRRHLRYKLGANAVRVSKMGAKTLKWFNKPTSRCKIILLTSKAGKGISLKNVYSFHLMEPQWSFADEAQAIGRCTRKGSHDLVDPQVRVTRWMAVGPGTRQRSADQRVHASMLEKKRATDPLNLRLAKAGKKHLDDLLKEFHRAQVVHTMK